MRPVLIVLYVWASGLVMVAVVAWPPWHRWYFRTARYLMSKQCYEDEKRGHARRERVRRLRDPFERHKRLTLWIWNLGALRELRL